MPPRAPALPVTPPSPASASPAAQDAVRRTLLQMVRERGAQASLCPSEVARRVAAEAGDDWRALMPAVRQAASELARAGRAEVLQRGQKQNPDGPWRGPIRVRWVPEKD